VIFEEVDKELFFEVVLTSQDFDQLEFLGGVIGDFICEISDAKTINVYIRKEKDLCLSLKDQKPKHKFIRKRKRGKYVLNELKNDS